jgi:hypothetical protein
MKATHKVESGSPPRKRNFREGFDTPCCHSESSTTKENIVIKFQVGDTVQIGNGSQRWLVLSITDELVTVKSHPSYATSAGGRTQRRVIPIDKVNGIWFRKGESE